MLQSFVEADEVVATLSPQAAINPSPEIPKALKNKNLAAKGLRV